MKQLKVLSFLLGSLVVAGAACAETLTVRVLKPGDFPGTIQVKRIQPKDAEELLEFHVQVMPRIRIQGGEALPVSYLADLQVFNGTKLVPAPIEVEHGLDGGRTFTFRVVAKHAGRSIFTYCALSDHTPYSLFLGHLAPPK